MAEKGWETPWNGKETDQNYVKVYKVGDRCCKAVMKYMQNATKWEKDTEKYQTWARSSIVYFVLC